MTGNTFNSRGFKIHPTLEGIENFREWFDGSKVTDVKGRPLVVFHGTGDDLGLHVHENTYWSEHSHVANIYASAPTRQVQGHGPNVTPTYLRITNPYVHDDIGTGQNLSHAVLGKRGTIAAVMDNLKARGYDGLHIINFSDLGGIQDQWVNFYPEQVKSALGNNGKFARNSFDINDSSTPRLELARVYANEFLKWFGKSKITDDGGRPLLMFHGAGESYHELKPNSYFTCAPNQALHYAKNATSHSQSPIVHPVFLRLDNPALVSDDFIEWAGYEPNVMTEFQDRGYDGMMNQSMTEVISFRPESVMHAGCVDHIADLNRLFLARKAHDAIAAAETSWQANIAIGKHGQP